MAELDLRSLVKRFPDGDEEVVAVDNVDLSLDDGEFLVLVGPSGCGKSTTLRMIAGLEEVSSGDIAIDDESIVGTEPRDRDIAMVFQNYALYPHMTARQNMGFGLKMAGDHTKDEIHKRVEETAEMMGIEELLEDKPRELSGGQQQRVALGRAIVRDPEVFLMDEPLSNLDAKLRAEMRTELKSLQQDLDVTTIYVTHDQTEAMTMGDRIAILDDGQLQQVGTPLECYHRPANRFVAGFIGSPAMNFLHADVTETGLQYEGVEFPLAGESADVAADLDDVVLGIRPEDIELSLGDHPEDANVVPVDVVEPLGDLMHVYVDVADTRLTVTVDGGVILEHGQEVGIRFPSERVHLFHPETGEALKNSEASLEQESQLLV